MTKDEGLRLALEALEEMQNAIYNIGGEHVIDLNFAIEQADVSEFAITAIKAALEAKDEPEYYGLTKDHLWMSISKEHYDRLKPEFRMTCYTTPPQQEAKDEPVAWWIPKHKAPDMVSKVRWSDECEPLYTTPPQRTWVGLTNEEIASVEYNNHPLDGIRSFARAIEAKLKEKNS